MVTNPDARHVIRRAVVPAAGYGTRLRPLTLALPKEMLPLGRKPVLEHVVDELRECGIRTILFVVSPGKEMVERYFGDGSAWAVSCEYVIQPEMKGLGEALLRAEDWCDGEPTLIAFGDCVIETGSPPHPTVRMLDSHTANRSEATVLAQRVPVESVSRYGVLQPASVQAALEPFQVSRIVEKPRPEEAPSDLAVAGRWIIGPEVFRLLKRAPYGSNGELSLTDAVALGISEGLRVWAVPLRGREARRDVGGWETYLTAVAEYAIRDAEYGARISRALNVER